MNILYGSELSAELREEMKLKVDQWKAQGLRNPCLAVILAGNDPASLSYVKGKAKACESTGIENRTYHLAEDVTQEELEALIKQCNEDDTVDGILVQLPLPKHLNASHALDCISPDKDVDGLHPVNVGKFYLDEPGFVPCTPLGVMAMLEKMGVEIDGKRAVVLGRSKLVGAPVARLLQNKQATVTICHSHTHNDREICRQADILIAAIGHPRFVTKDFIKEGAVVIDVGINRDENGKLCGDVDFEDVKDHCSWITPVPKGVGPMTICMLLKNTLQAYEEKL